MSETPDFDTSVALACPWGYTALSDETARAAYCYPLEQEGKWKIHCCLPCGGSLLSNGFNSAYARALNLFEEGKCRYFAMLHSDVIPEDLWLTKLLDRMDSVGADLMGTVVAIKDDSGDCSLAIDHEDSPFTPRRLSMLEISQMPTVFNSEHLGGPLLLNTGCFVFDMAHPRTFEDLGKHYSNRLKLMFSIDDWLGRNPIDGLFTPLVASEDWNFSRVAHHLEMSVWCDRSIRIRHRGVCDYDNRLAVDGKRCHFDKPQQSPKKE